MKQALQDESTWLRKSVVRLAHIHFAYAAAYVIQIILYDVWKLVTPQIILMRWLAAAALLLVTVIVWYVARSGTSSTPTLKWLVWALITADVALAAFNVYYQRGMASRAVFLFVIPIIVSASLLSRSAIFTTAILAVIAYSTSALAYFVLNFNEGLKIELYGEVGFYCTMFIVLASMLWSIVRTSRKL